MIAIDTDPETFDADRYISGLARGHQPVKRSLGDRILSYYNAALGTATGAALVGSALYAMRDQIASQIKNPSHLLVSEQWAILSPIDLMTLLSAAALTIALFTARSLGPMTLSQPKIQWVLPLPIDRRDIVSRPFSGIVVGAGALSALVHGAASFVLLPATTPMEHALGGAVFGGLVSGILLVAAHQQLNTQSKPDAARAWWTIPACMAAAVLPRLSIEGHLWPLFLTVLILPVFWRSLTSKMGLITMAELVRGSAIASHTGFALFSMDGNELSRALTGHASEDKRRGEPRSRSWANGPVRALLRADLVAFNRQRRWWLPPAGLLLVTFAVLLLDSGISDLIQLVAILLISCAAASSLGGIARRTAIADTDRLLPLPDFLVRSVRMTAPAVVMCTWILLLVTGFVLMGGGTMQLIMLAPMAAIGMAAGIFRGAYKSPPDWSQPPIDTPFGPLPQVQLTNLVRGLDVSAMSFLPIAIGMYVGDVTLPLILLAGVTSAGGWALTHRKQPSQIV